MRGVPRSPDRHLDEFRIFGNIEWGGFEVQTDRFFDVGSGFRLGIAGGGAAREFGAYGRVGAGFVVIFEDHAEGHVFSVRGLRFELPARGGKHIEAAVSPRSDADWSGNRLLEWDTKVHRR